MINILYVSDDKFAPVLSVSIASLIEHNKNINIIILDNGIKKENKKRLYMLHDSVKIVPVNGWAEKITCDLKCDRGTDTQYVRMFISDRLPLEYRRILYLDCDLLIQGDLREIYEISMEEYIIAGVEDAFSAFNRKVIGMDKKDTYINSGLMLIDLEKWRNERVEDKFLAFIEQRKGKIPHGDQGIINAVLRGRIKRLPLKWNVAAYNFDFTYEEMKLYRNPSKYYCRDEFEEAREKPEIVHFTTSFASMRPWQNNRSEHPYAKEWLEIYEKNGFAVEKNSYKVSYIIYRFIPHKVLLLCIRIMHSYIKPLIDAI